MTGTPVGTWRKLRSRDRIVPARASGAGRHHATPNGHARVRESRPEAQADGVSATRRTGMSVVRTDIQRST